MYFDKTTIPNEISQRERLKIELINTLPAQENSENFLRSQRYLQQNRAELKKIKELKGQEMSFQQWIQTVSSSNPEMPFELSPEEMYVILKELVNNGTIPEGSVNILELIKKPGKKGKDGESKQAYFTRIFKTIPAIQPLFLKGQIRRANYISMFDKQNKTAPKVKASMTQVRAMSPERTPAGSSDY